MKFDLEFTKHVPIYIQLTEQVKHAIAAGELEPGDQLPPVRELAADLGVNFNTVARVYRVLDEEGIISTQHGRGTFILPPRSNRKSEALRREDLQALAEHFVTKVKKLDLPKEDVQKVVEQLLKKE